LLNDDSEPHLPRKRVKVVRLRIVTREGAGAGHRDHTGAATVASSVKEGSRPGRPPRLSDLGAGVLAKPWPLSPRASAPARGIGCAGYRDLWLRDR